MGGEVDDQEFFDEDYQRFSLRLQHCLIALRELLGRPDFGGGPASIGAELEFALVEELEGLDELELERLELGELDELDELEELDCEELELSKSEPN